MQTQNGESSPLKLITFVTLRSYEWAILTKWKSEVGAVLYNPTSAKAKDQSKLKIRVFPYGYTKVKFTWTELVATKEKAEKAVCKEDRSKPKYNTIVTFNGTDQVLGVRTEFVNLRLYETHPVIVRVRTNNKANMYVVLLVKYVLHDPLRVIALDDSMVDFSSTYISGIVREWCSKKSDEDLFQLSNKNTVDNQEELFDSINNLNEEFDQWGFKTTGFSIPIVSYADDSLVFQKINQDIEVGKGKVKVAEQNKLAAEHDTAAQAKRNETELAFREKDANIKKQLIVDTATYLAMVNKAWGEGGLQRLIINGGGEYTNFGQKMLQSNLEVKDFADDDTDDRRKPNKTKEVSS